MSDRVEKSAMQKGKSLRRPRRATVKNSLAGGLSLRALEIFVAVARAGTMVAAAKKLNLTQPAVSQVISALEANIGVQLFDRSTRPPALTLQGTALIEHASAILDAARRFQSAIRLGSALPLPSLRIGMLNSFATTVGPHMIRSLRNVAGEWSIDSGFHATRYGAVVDREFDLVITADESPVPAGVHLMPILTEPFLLVLPAAHRMRSASLNKLSGDLDLIRFGRDPNLHSRIDRVLLDVGIVPPRRYHLDTAEAVLAMIAAGLGWTILSPLAVVKWLERKNEI